MKLFYELGYRYFRMPWEIGPRAELIQLVESQRLAPCRTIDLGCGTGDNAIFLAQHEFEVTGVDYTSSAIEKAKRKAEAAAVKVEFVVDDLTNLQKVKDTFDFLLDYGSLDDLSPKDRERYVLNVLPLTRPGSRYLLWCFEWQLHWWENILMRLFPFIGGLTLDPGEAQRRFSEYFAIEQITGEANLTGWPRGFAAYLMTRNRASEQM